MAKSKKRRGFGEYESAYNPNEPFFQIPELALNSAVRAAARRAGYNISLGQAACLNDMMSRKYYSGEILQTNDHWPAYRDTVLGYMKQCTTSKLRRQWNPRVLDMSVAEYNRYMGLSDLDY